jgi:hypothetical protein
VAALILKTRRILIVCRLSRARDAAAGRVMWACVKFQSSADLKPSKLPQSNVVVGVAEVSS